MLHPSEVRKQLKRVLFSWHFRALRAPYEKVKPCYMKVKLQKNQSCALIHKLIFCAGIHYISML